MKGKLAEREIEIDPSCVTDHSKETTTAKKIESLLDETAAELQELESDASELPAAPSAVSSAAPAAEKSESEEIRSTSTQAVNTTEHYVPEIELELELCGIRARQAVIHFYSVRDDVDYQARVASELKTHHRDSPPPARDAVNYVSYL